ncbi:MAG TPA: hypothetical protein VGD68_01820 [Streptosporangiaceae bacterium]
MLAASDHFLLKYSGVFALLALTGSVCVGVVATDRIVMTPGHRVMAQAVHRAVSFGALAFLIVHIVLEITAPHLEESPTQHVHLLDAFIPFLSQYRTFYMAEGTIASDIIVLLVITGIIRRRFTASGHAWKWRIIHYSSYAALVLGVLHGLLAGRKAIGSFVYWSYGIVIVLVALAVLVRILASSLSSREAVRGASPQSDLSRAGGSDSMSARAAAVGLMGQLTGAMPLAGANRAVAAAGAAGIGPADLDSGMGAAGMGAAGVLAAPVPSAPWPSADPPPRPALAALPGPAPYGADPYGADSYGADPYGADPYGADRYGADSYGADPYGADSYGADPYGADLSGADPYGADPYGPALYGAGGPGARLAASAPGGPGADGRAPRYEPGYVGPPRYVGAPVPPPPNPAGRADAPMGRDGTGPQPAYRAEPYEHEGLGDQTSPLPVYPSGPPPGYAAGPPPGYASGPGYAAGPGPEAYGPPRRRQPGSGYPRDPGYLQDPGYAPGRGYAQEADYEPDRDHEPGRGYAPDRGYGPGEAPYSLAGYSDPPGPHGRQAPYGLEPPYEPDAPYEPVPNRGYYPDQQEYPDYADQPGRNQAAPPRPPAGGYPGPVPPGQRQPGRGPRSGRTSVHGGTGPLRRVPSQGGDERR